MLIGERICRARKSHDWTQTYLAALAGVSQAAVSQIEHGQRGGGLVKVLASFVGVSLTQVDHEDILRAEIEENLKGISPRSLKLVHDLVSTIKRSEQR